MRSGVGSTSRLGQASCLVAMRTHMVSYSFPTTAVVAPTDNKAAAVGAVSAGAGTTAGLARISGLNTEAFKKGLAIVQFLGNFDT